MQELDMPVNMRTILAKLPYKMREQWRSTAHGIMERTQQRAHFTDLVAFVERHVKILSDPLFGDIQDPVFAAAGTKTLTRFKSYPGNRVKGNIVATTVTCGQTHPTVLHIKRQPAAPEQKKQPASFQTCGHTGAGKDGCALPILPVSVKSAKGNDIQTYAFLDPGSSATFCSEDLMQRLNVTGRGTSFLLSTMGQETVVPAYSITDLEVAGLDGNDFYSLPEVLSQRKMPVTTNNIITTEELDKWSYLSDVHIPHIKANVDLLIGTNAPKLLEPWEVINSHGNGPYAIRTVLGWIINGPLSGSSGALETEFLSATVNRISVRKLEEMLTSQYMHDFNEKTYDKEEMSDMRFLEIVSHSAKLQDGHYSLKMPFRKEHPTFSNNLSMAKQMLLGLKRRFQRDERFHQEYASFFTDVISNGYAEKVPQHQLDGVEGKVWYIPHHGVYHPRKNTLRVVFDCAATFKGTSLNSQLLQGPNLTSSLLGVLTRFRQEPVAVMGDIQKMFYQVKVAETDKDFLCFLWWPEGDMKQEVTEYRMMFICLEPFPPRAALATHSGKQLRMGKPAVPPGVFVKQDLYVKRRSQVQYLSDLFWK